MIPKSIRRFSLAILIASLVVTACSGAPESNLPSPASAATAIAQPASPALTASQVASPTPSPTFSPNPSPAPTTTPPASVIDGLWEATTTRAELLAAGAGPDEDSDENWGHLFQEFHNGIWGGAESGGVVGTYRLEGHKIFLTLTTTEDAGLTFTGTWELVGGKLKLGGGIPTPMRVKPWTKVGP